jgi:A/G-specific adenine glycosylase
MDLGATLCVRSKPDCQACPLSKRCQALAEDRVQELPTKKKAAAKPIRQARFFVLRLPDNRVLLEQRQQSGLWGGLWNPPERGVEVSIETFLRHQGVAQQDVIATQTGERFRHTFSHFHLDIEPVYIDLKRQPRILQETNQRWVAADRLNQPTVQAAKPSDETIGLSAAAVKILAP